MSGVAIQSRKVTRVRECVKGTNCTPGAKIKLYTPLCWFYSVFCVLLWPFWWKPSILVDWVGRRLDIEYLRGVLPKADHPTQTLTLTRRLWDDQCLASGGGVQSIICTPDVHLGIVVCEHRGGL